jgi:3-oxoacyl-[acyl-carrier protein] reductase
MAAITPAQALFDLTGEVALVTGASSGLGARFAEVLSAHGAKVVLAARRLDRIEALAQRLGNAKAIALLNWTSPSRRVSIRPSRLRGR